jgi:hypothetical protein
MLGRVVKLETLRQTPRLRRRKRLLKRSRSVRIQVVQHHRDPFGCRVVPVGEFTHGHRPICSGAPLRHLDLTPAGEWFGKQKQIGDTVSFLFVILARRSARGNR